MCLLTISAGPGLRRAESTVFIRVNLREQGPSEEEEEEEEEEAVEVAEEEEWKVRGKCPGL